MAAGTVGPAGSGAGYLERRADLAGRRAVLVGGGGGLGRACALDLAGAGVRVALCDVDPAALEATAADVVAAGGQVTVAAGLDAREPEALAAFFEQVDRAFDGGLDVLVNVVGGTFHQPFTASRPSGWEALVRTNFTWLLHAVQLAAGRMDGGGSIVNLTSIEAHRAAPGYAVYGAMKAAVTSLSRTLAVELAPAGIRVNTVAPDYVPTPGMGPLVAGSSAGDEALRRRIATPMGRAGTFEDVGGCVLFLASELSSFVTGTTLHPDGGALAASGWYNWPGTGFANHPPDEVVAFLRDR